MPTDYRFTPFGCAAQRVLCACLSVLIALTAVPPRADAGTSFASIVLDHHTGRVLQSDDADELRYPASLTKMMTLYVLFEHLRAHRLAFDTPFHVSRHAQAQPPTKVGVRQGDMIRVDDAIKALVTKSANDVAAVVAENIAGSEPLFAGIMTVRARQIGMSRTTFRNASGLPDSEQVTTARDMATLSQRLIEEFPEYFEFFSLKSFTYRKRRYPNHNGLLYTYRGTDGIKTGYTRASGFNLAASVRRQDKHLVAVVLGGKSSRQRNRHMMALLDRALPAATPQPPPLPKRKPERPPTTVAEEAFQTVNAGAMR